MKWSKYNFLIESPKFGFLLYNSLSNSFLELDKETYLYFTKLAGLDVINTEALTVDKKQLISSKIIVENDEDELLRVKLNKHLARFNNSYLSLTVAPTLDCNLNCKYCFESNRPPIYMERKDELNLIKFIKSYKNINSYSIAWYGGEPLMAFDSMLRITKSVKKISNIYFSSLITNGVLLDEHKVKELINLNIFEIQITIDGLENIHNSRRPCLEETNSFQTIIKNLDHLMNHEFSKKIRVTVRVNIDKENKDSYSDLYFFLKKRYKNKPIYVYPGFVIEATGACTSTNENFLNRKDMVDFKLELYKKNGIVEKGFFPTLHTGECMARKVNSYLVDPKGNLYKCWTDIGSIERSVGNINKKGSVNERLLTRYLTGADPFDRPECQKCTYMPICGGGCTFFALKKHFEKSNHDICCLEKGDILPLLEAHYEILQTK